MKLIEIEIVTSGFEINIIFYYKEYMLLTANAQQFNKESFINNIPSMVCEVYNERFNQQTIKEEYHFYYNNTNRNTKTGNWR